MGVHIADVSHFVQPDSALDKEAQQRSTSGASEATRPSLVDSRAGHWLGFAEWLTQDCPCRKHAVRPPRLAFFAVYLVDRVIPMLPRLLCEELCRCRAWVHVPWRHASAISSRAVQFQPAARGLVRLLCFARVRTRLLDGCAWGACTGCRSDAAFQRPSTPPQPEPGCGPAGLQRGVGHGRRGQHRVSSGVSATAAARLRDFRRSFKCMPTGVGKRGVESTVAGAPPLQPRSLQGQVRGW